MWQPIESVPAKWVAGRCRRLGIRSRLLMLALGVAIPLALVGVVGLRVMWTLSRAQLDDSIKQQAELVAVAFERWVDAQRQPLTTLAELSATQDVQGESFTENLRATVATRPHWIDLRVADSGGRTLVAQPAGREELPSALTAYLLAEVRRRGSWVVVTDRTRDELRPLFAIAAPRADGGAVIARVDGVAMRELFRDIELSARSVIAVFDGERRILFRRQTLETPVDAQVSGAPLFASLGEQRAAVVEVESPYDGVRRVYGLAHAGATEFIVLVGIPSAALYEPARRQYMRYGFFSLLALGCAIIAALLIERGIARPIRRLRTAAQQLGAGELSARSPVTGQGEIGELGEAFNHMAQQIAEREERLAQLDRLKSEFVSSVSHELRTPLTTIKTLTHVLQRGGQTDVERQAYLDTIAAECDRQIDLVLNLLDLTRIEAGAYKVSFAEVSASQLVTNCVAVEQHAAQARGHRLAADVPAELPPVRTDHGALRRVVCSLVENAIKYTPDGGEIIVSARVTADGEEVALAVTDNGCGVATQDVPRIFEKFFRGRPAADDSTSAEIHDSAHESNETPGIGLGLYLARNIVEQLGGRITVAGVARGGTTFTVYVPVWRSEDRAGEPDRVQIARRNDVETSARR